MKGFNICLKIPEQQRLRLYKQYHNFHNPIEQTELDFSKLDPNIIELDFSNVNYNYPLDNIPPQIVSLILSQDYNYPLDNLHCNLKQLLLAYNYNQPLDYLPINLEILRVGSYYTQDLYNLPKSLKTLILNNIPHINLDLPNLTTLYLNFNNDKNLENIENTDNFSNQVNNLNKTLKELVLSSNIFSTRYINMNILENFNVLEHLNIGNYKNRIEKFPPNLKHLILDSYCHVLDNLPDTIEILEIGYECYLDLNYLPKNLKILDMGENIECNILVNYPESLEELKIIETHPQKNELDLIYKNFKITMIIDYDAREEHYEYMKSIYKYNR